MGKPTGFIEYLRELPVDRSPAERVRDWNEFHHHMDEKRLRQQGARCMDCGVPFCHTGKLISRHGLGLPGQQPHPGVERPGVSRPVARGARSPASRPTTSRSSPAACARRRAKARACSASTRRRSPSRTSRTPSSTRAWDEGWIVAGAADDAHRQEGRGHRLRSRGPRGRGAAQQGRPLGDRARARRSPGRPAHVRHSEHEARQARSGRAPHQAAWRRKASSSSATPTSARTSRRELLLKDFDATVICTGATQPRDLPVEGRDLKGVHFAMDFLTVNTQAVLKDAPDATPITAKGKDVVVIGGGDTGTDCVGTSMRHGCKSLMQIEIMPMPPMDRADGQSVAGVAQGLQAGLRPGRGRREVRRRPARLSDHREEVRRRRRRQSRRRRHREHQVGEERQGPVHSRSSSPAARRNIPRSSCCWPWVSSGPSRRCSRTSRSKPTRAAT